MFYAKVIMQKITSYFLRNVKIQYRRIQSKVCFVVEYIDHHKLTVKLVRKNHGKTCLSSWQNPCENMVNPNFNNMIKIPVSYEFFFMIKLQELMGFEYKGF